uniref:DUF4062 domain-containing protein n=1 Tax=Protofrankia symbiont of Coriaria ruscifolia TaxID=1306542 RepID=UPI001040E4CF
MTLPLDVRQGRSRDRPLLPLAERDCTYAGLLAWIVVRDLDTVFVSHASDMSEYPSPRSFVQVTCEAILTAGARPVEMGHFGARESKPAEYCRQRVRECDVYLAVIGFRYGSLVPDAEGVSYTELEFLEATAAGLPRLVFLLDPDAAIPRRLVDVDGRPIEDFRQRLCGADLIVRMFTDTGDLGGAVLHALGELRAQQSVRNRTGDSVSMTRRPQMVPAATGPVVDRPELLEALVTGLTAPGSAAGGLTTGLEGAGGFGKTTLAAQACRRPEVAARFPGGLLWATVGQHRDGADLAGEISRLCEVLSDERPATADPHVAGARLGELLDGREATLLVIDDVWSRGQLEPFLIAGSACRRLVTTRNARVVSRDSLSLLVDEMTPAQAVATLTAGITGMSTTMVDRLLRLIGRWPVLLGLVNAAITGHMQTGASPDQAAGWVSHRLEIDGPTAVDIDNAESRAHAVSATVTASLNLLSASEQDRYLDLAIFPEDVDVDVTVLGLLWGATGGLDVAQCHRLWTKLVQLRLALGRWHEDAPALGLHDVIRAYLRHRLTTDDLAARHTAFVSAARALLPGPAEPSTPARAWWELPDQPRYLWQYLAYHLHGSRCHDELAELVCALQWVEAKTHRLGSPAPAVTDLALADAPAADILRRALQRDAHLLTPIEPASALGATLASRLDGIPGLDDIVSSYRPGLPRPRLDNDWPLPDRPDLDGPPHPSGHRGPVSSCAFFPDGTLIVTASDDATLRLWETATGALVRTLHGHTGRVLGCAFSPDGRLIVSAGGDGTVRLWETMTGTAVRMLYSHTGQVLNCAFSPDGTLIVSAGSDGLRVWQTASGTLVHALQGHTGRVQGCAFSPDGGLIVSAGGDGTVRLWQTATAALVLTLHGHTGRVGGCAFSPDGRLIVSTGHDGTVRLWQTATGALVHTLQGHTSSVIG